MADSDYFGGPRHAPAPQITPMSQDQVGGTSAILNAAGRSRPRKAGIGSMPKGGALGSPLDVGAHKAILGAAKLGQQGANPKSAPNDEAFNRDSPRPANTGNPGDPDNPHPLMSRMRDALSIRGGESAPTPLRTASLDDYPNLDYSPMTMPEMRQRMGLPPDLFGEG